MTGPEWALAILVPTLVLLSLGLAIFWVNPPRTLSDKPSRKQQLEDMRFMKERIKLKIEMYYETKELAGVAKRHPELKKDIEEFIALRNTLFDSNYTLENINGGEEDEQL